jgi:hypothetical protein
MAATLMTVLNPQTQMQKAQDAKRKGDLSQMQKALETYYNDYGQYPAQASSSDYRIKGLDGNPVSWGGSWDPYMTKLPADPTSSKKYVYVSSGQSYYIYASLDRKGNDSQACKSNGDPCVSAVTNNVSTVCGDNCNYGVSSPNVSP